MESPEIWLRTICRKNGLRLEDGQLSLLSQYTSLLLEWNKKINLISRKDEANVWENHILHSISILFKIRFVPKCRMLDLGSGGGLPGIPLKVVCPDISLTILDATQKKVNAVTEMIKQMSLDGVESVWGRAEEMGKKDKFFKKFDYVLARAVAPLKDLVPWSQPFLSESHAGTSSQAPETDVVQIEPPALVALKGGNLEEELTGIDKQKYVQSASSINLVFDGSERIMTADKKIVIVRFKKEA